METPDPLISCPYNQSHQILKSRMQYHLTKCRKNHPDAETEICPLDATHHIPKPELPFHLTVCPNRRLVECAKYVTTDSTEKASLPPYKQPLLPPSVENWDLETVTSSYQPSQKAAEAPVLRQLIGATKSERKKFRLQERRRVQELHEKGYFDPQESSIPSKSSAPLRLPADFVPVSGNPDMGLGRGTSQKSEEKSVEDSLAAFSSLSLSMGRGTPKESNSPSKISTPGNLSKASVSSFAAAVNAGKGSCRQPGQKSSDDPVTKFTNLSMSMGRGTGAIPRTKFKAVCTT